MNSKIFTKNNLYTLTPSSLTIRAIVWGTVLYFGALEDTWTCLLLWEGERKKEYTRNNKKGWIREEKLGWRKYWKKNIWKRYLEPNLDHIKRSNNESGDPTRQTPRNHIFESSHFLSFPLLCVVFIFCFIRVKF